MKRKDNSRKTQTTQTNKPAIRSLDSKELTGVHGGRWTMKDLIVSS